MDKKQLISRLNIGKSLDFGDVLSESFELLKNTWVNALLFVVMQVAVITPIYFIVFFATILIGGIGVFFESFLNGSNSQSQSTIVTVLFVVLFIVIYVFFIVLYHVMYLGYMKTIRDADLGKNFDIKKMFYFLKTRYLGKVLGIMVLSLILIMTSLLLCFFPILFVIPFLSKINTVFAYNPELSISDVFLIAFETTKKHFGILLGLNIVSIMMSQLGVIACGVGMLFTFSYVLVVDYVTYKKIFGFDSKLDDDINLIVNKDN